VHEEKAIHNKLLPRFFTATPSIIANSAFDQSPEQASTNTVVTAVPLLSLKLSPSTAPRKWSYAAAALAQSMSTEKIEARSQEIRNERRLTVSQDDEDDDTTDDVTTNDNANSNAANAIRAKLLKRKRSDRSHGRQDAQGNLQVSFLGTGSATPSKHRNNSCIMLQYQGLITLLDVGEGVTSQLYHNCSRDMALFDASLLSIRLIWISHHHCDHIAGYPMLLQHIQQARIRHPSSIQRSKITVICPSHVQRYYDFIANACGLEELATLLPMTNSLYAGMSSSIQSITSQTIIKLQSLPVYHCQEAYAVVMSFANNLKVVYSGDCRPCDSLIAIGHDADLLIHEATFDESMQEDAVKKKHSTIAEALQVSQKMNAKFTILTHFSQRYPSSIKLSTTNTSLSLIAAARYALAYDFLHFSYPNDIQSLVESVRLLLQSESVETADEVKLNSDILG
jgi:ribonuclease BN (tRNA processing enzyme)